MKISRLSTRAFRLPLRERMTSSKYSMTHRELVLVTVDTDEGVSGTGWFTTAGIGGLSAKTLIDAYLVPLLLGEDPRNSERLWARLWANVHASSPGGLATLAISAIDIALWDIKGKVAGEPLHRLLGGARDAVGIYASAINLHLSKQQLLGQVREHQRLGYKAFKLKVGKPDPTEDLERCGAVRDLLGPAAEIMLDANQKWQAGEAINRCAMLAEVAPLFIEEPLLSDDIAGHAHLRAQSRVPIAVGETLSNRFEFWNYVQAGAVDFLQPDVWKVGGVTEWLKIGAVAASANLIISPHYSLEISIHLAAATPCCAAVENIFGLSLHDLGATNTPLPIHDGVVDLSAAPGHGVVFDGPALADHEITGGFGVQGEALAL